MCAFGKCLKSNKWLIVKLLKTCTAIVLQLFITSQSSAFLSLLGVHYLLSTPAPCPGILIFPPLHTTTTKYKSSGVHAASTYCQDYSNSFLFIFPCQMLSDGPKPECQLVKSALTWHNTKASINQQLASRCAFHPCRLPHKDQQL